MFLSARYLLFLGLALSASAFTHAANDAPYRVAAGVNLGGGQLDWRINRSWMLEARAQSDNDVNNGATTTSEVIGLRGYRFFGTRHPELFVGLQASTAQARQSSSSYEARGWAAGAFGGVELRLMRHLFLMADGGPYVVSLRQNDAGVSNGLVTFVADLALVVGF